MMMKVGFYYSLLDWHHPDFEIDRIHPQAPKDPKDYKKLCTTVRNCSSVRPMQV
ncbi:MULTISPECIES: hypothetical protein [Bacteroidales]|uniref:hypothetical protein n=1 Tax=Bacteroidales TaxID=171549 RepID=UPI0015FB8BED|nr:MULTISPECIES: hypothetical protein [Bacteroidales]MDB9246146.1 hypothetical protein [Odoribacter splanchnicus]